MTKKEGKIGEANDLLLGVDLGTSRTAVMTNRGLKTMFDSVVGYPKDIIAAKLIQDSQLIGAKALEQAQSLDMYAPLENGMIKKNAGPKDLESVHALLEHALLQADAHEGDRKCAVIGVPAEASTKNIGQLLELAKDIFDIALVVSEPFLVAYGMERIVNAVVVDIGAGTTDTCILKGSLPGPKDQISTNKAGDYLDRQLLAMILHKFPDIQVNQNQARQIKERYAFVGDQDVKAKVKARERGKPVVIDCTEEVGKVCEELVPGIVEGIEKLVIGFNPEKQEEVLKNIFLAGGGSLIKGLDTMVEERLKDYGEVKVTTVMDPDYAGCEGALKLATDVAPDNWDKIGPVCGK
ncbi:MAG: MamK family actin-like protein [Desulfobulbaceae bacterium]|nr:MamK family actin-like protein [Desulfobulbaceae bacterium]HIJ79387.1 hypothetical protein [Deltaproteobacteria bacterium]